jgi:hypothetical protein
MEEEPKSVSQATTPTRTNSGNLLDFRRTDRAPTTRQPPPADQPAQAQHEDWILHKDALVNLPSVVQQIDDRAEIETPSPARVSELRQKLWTENEHLRMQWMKQRQQQQQQQQQAAAAKLKTALGSPEEGRRFKERYHAAAKRGLLNYQSQLTKVPPRLGNNNGQVGVHGESVDALIFKLGTVNRDDPQAALDQIDEILRKQAQAEPQSNTPHMDPNDIDDSASHDSSVSSITDPTYEELSKSQLNQGASASALGRTRPSSLAKYSKPDHVVDGSLGTTNRLRPHRKHRGAFPSMSELESEPNEAKDPVPPIASRSFVQIKRDLEKDDDIRDEDSSGSGILDSGADELERKIRRWDELSTGIIPSIFDNNVQPADQQDIAEKAHPWKGLPLSNTPSLVRNTPTTASVINFRETTMNSADGIEAEYSAGQHNKAPAVQERSVASVRALRKERLSREQRPTTIVEEDTAIKELHLVQQTNDAFDEFLPAYNPRQENAKAMADDYDSAWINLPESKYFGRSSRGQLSSDTLRSRLDQADTNGFADDRLRHLPDGEVEVGYMNMDYTDADQQAIYAGDRDMTSRDNGMGLEARRVKSSAALKGLLSQRTDEHRRGDQMTYTSTGSRRYRDLKAKLEHNEQRDLNQRRSKADSSNLSRARSLDDRIERRENARGSRNPNLAKKFSRLLQVYDDEKSRGQRSR